MVQSQPRQNESKTLKRAGGMAQVVEYLPRLASNLDPPNLSLPSSQGYRGEQLMTDWQ
jgi:hypothetical protein